MKYSITIWSSIICIISAVIALIITDPNITVQFSEDEVQGLLNKKLPLNVKKKGLDMTVYEGSKVYFQNDGSVRVFAKFQAKPSLIDYIYTGSAEIKSSVHYDNGNFYLRGLELINLTGKTEISKGTKIAGKILKNKFTSFMKKNGATQEDRDYIINKIKEDVPKRIYAIIENTPIYKIKHGILKKSLTDINIENKQVTAILSVGKFILWILLLIASMLFAAVIFIAIMSSSVGLMALLLFQV